MITAEQKELLKSMQLFLFDMNQDYDILYFTNGKRYTDQIMNDISEGIEIYRREPA